MIRRCKGSLTIEAAIVLPFMVLLLVTLLWFSQLWFIQDQVHSAMTKAAHSMAVEGYAADNLGILDLQQGIYQEHGQAVDAIQSSWALASGQQEILAEELTNVTSYSQSVYQWTGSVKPLPEHGDWSVTAVEAIRIVREGSGLVESVTDSTLKMIQALKALAEESMNHGVALATGEVLQMVNGITASEMAAYHFGRYVTDQQLEQWGVEAIDFGLSAYLLPDDTIEVVAVYEVPIPIAPWLTDGQVPVIQKATARAWTGSYDSGEQKSRIKKEGSSKETLVYVATATEGNHSYHYLSCLRKPLIASTYKEEVVKHDREVCAYCEKHSTVSHLNMEVFYTSSGSKIHLNAKCPRVYAISVEAMTEEEALQRGYDPCDKEGCIGKSKEGNKE